ncbi:MAG: hypothetical protein ACE5GM_10625 [bacterium]
MLFILPLHNCVQGGDKQSMISDEFSEYYREVLDTSYDCTDRIVLNAYFALGQSPGGFRTWWRELMGSDDNLDNTNLMRFAGRFARRIRAYAEKESIPLIYCKSGDRKHDLGKAYLPSDPNFKGVFCIMASRAPAPVYDIQRFKTGGMNITRKTPSPWVNHYSFHIIDPQWGWVTIRLIPHPPFNAMVILNGHEYVAKQAREKELSFTKEDNCFTEISNGAGLATIADTMKVPDFVGRLAQVCERWIYSSCLCFALTLEEQKKSRFRYSYSVYQSEYSRNLLFSTGRMMDKVFNGVIDRTRSALDLKTIKTIFGYKQRPGKRKTGKPPRFEVVVEKPDYGLTVLRIHFASLTVKIYSKGERVLRIEAVSHNTRYLRCGRVIENFPRIVNALKKILERFLQVLRAADISFLDTDALEKWHLPGVVGATRVGGVDMNKPRLQAVMKAITALSTNPLGFTASELAEKMKENSSDFYAGSYTARNASYDLKKLRGKKLVRLINRSRRYEATREGLHSMAAFITLRENVLMPLLAGASKGRKITTPPNQSEVDLRYQNIQQEMLKLFETVGIAA